MLGHCAPRRCRHGRHGALSVDVQAAAPARARACRQCAAGDAARVAPAERRAVVRERASHAHRQRVPGQVRDGGAAHTPPKPAPKTPDAISRAAAALSNASRTCPSASLTVKASDRLWHSSTRLTCAPPWLVACTRNRDICLTSRSLAAQHSGRHHRRHRLRRRVAVQLLLYFVRRQLRMHCSRQGHRAGSPITSN